MLYNTLSLPYLSYCSEVWGRTYKTNLNPLFVKQKNFLRIIGKVSRYDHTTPNSLYLRFIRIQSCMFYVLSLFEEGTSTPQSFM